MNRRRRNVRLDSMAFLVFKCVFFWFSGRMGAVISDVILIDEENTSGEDDIIVIEDKSPREKVV